MKLRSLNKTLSISGLKTGALRWLSRTAAKMRDAARDDAGVALVAIVFVFGSAALVTTAMLVLEEQGVPAQLRSTKNQQAALKKIEQALELHILLNNAVPCPADGTADDGLSVASCDDGANDENAGVIPWATIGLGKEDALDGFGNVFTYVAATNLAEDGVDRICERIAGEISGDVIDGNINIDTDNDMVNSADITDAVYAVIGHGANRAGGYTSGGTHSGTPTSTLEDNNSIAGGAGSLALLNAFPQALQGDATDVFDDAVLYKEPRDLREVCESIVEQGDVNNFLFVDFEGSTDLADNFTTNTPGGGTSAQADNNGDNVNILTDDVSLDTNLQFSVDLAPTYVSMDWTPTVGTEGGLSLITRSGGGNPDSTPDTYSNGITFRFWEDKGAANIGNGAANANNIGISCTADCGGITLSSDTVDIRLNRAYTVELYDDGEKVWARMYEIDDPTNQASLFIQTPSVVNEDVNNFPNRLTILNVDDTAGSTGITSRIDDVLVARAMGAVAFDGDTLGTPDSIDFDGTDANVNVQFNAATPMTLELLLKPTDSLSGGDTFVSKWDVNGPQATHQSFLLAMNGSGTAIEFSHVSTIPFPPGSTDASTCTSSIDPTVGEWTHIAVTFDASFVRIYQDGELNRTCGSLTNIKQSGLASVPFRIGAGIDTGAAANGFEGEIAEVRLWSVLRTETEIDDNYRRRILSNDPDIANLNLYWHLDLDDTNGGSILFAGDEAPCNAISNCTGSFGSLVDGAAFVGARDETRLPFADDVCAGEEDSLFSCLYDLADSGQTATIPVNLPNVNVTMWGGGGGSSDNYGVTPSRNAGGAGGYGSGRFARINATDIAGDNLVITVGAGGAAGTGNNGGSGGGASSVRNDGTDIAMLVGGGGGAGTGNTIDFSGGGASAGDCDDATDADLCGSGGGGGGANLDGLAGPDSVEAGGDECGGNPGLAAGTPGAATSETDDTLCTVDGEGGSGGDGGSGTAGGGGSGGGGAGDGSGGTNNVEGGGGGGGFAGGGAGADASTPGDVAFGGGGGAGEVDAVNVQSLSAESGEIGGTTLVSGNVYTGLPGGVDDSDPTNIATDGTSDAEYSRTFATCTSSGLGTPGRGGETMAATGFSGEDGCDGAVVIAW